MLPKIPDRITGFVAVTPRDAQHALVYPLHVRGFENQCTHTDHRPLMPKPDEPLRPSLRDSLRRNLRR